MWDLFHRYRALVAEGKAKALACPDCGIGLITTKKSGDEELDLWLWCMSCSSLMKPGLDVLDRVRAVVNEHTA